MAFADFPEQQQVVQLLQRSLERGRLGHAYLFTGSAIGELEQMAATLAKTLNCLNPRTPAIDSCDHCNSCRKIDERIHPDIRWVRPESKMRQITIDQMRDVMEAVNLKATEAKYKILIIVSAERMNVQAANSFLKTLEEPPAHSIIILLTTDPSRLLETILSRCLRLHFSGSGAVRMTPMQREFVELFGQTAAREQGLLGRYRLLDTLLGRLAKLREEIEAGLTAKSPLEKYDDVDPSLREKWEYELVAAIEADYRRQRSDLLVALEWWLRDVWLVCLASDTVACQFPDLKEAAVKVAQRIKPHDAVGNLAILEQTQTLLQTNVQEALALEVGFLKLKL